MPPVLAKAVLVLALLAAGLYLLVAMGMFAFQRQFLFVPMEGPIEPAEAGLFGYELAHFQSADRLDIPYWRHRPADGSAPLILFFHGNGGGLHVFAPSLRRLAEQGFAVGAMAYRGYPGAPGAPSEEALVADAKLFAQAMTAAEPERPLVLWGYSLGSGIATQLAEALDGERVVVLEAPFTSARDRAGELYPFLPVGWLMRDPFDSLSRIGSIGSALFVMHGEADGVIPSAHSERLFAAAKEPKLRVSHPQADHFNLEAFGAYDAAFEFIAEHAGAAAPAP
ncbi:MAG TPA: alpha/beta fold hydrolase [Mesorhizobium sp.]|jgi:hypothetical protein|nr:alpha/beta fold hydrolase [Mesorhizobium sp.]